MSTTLPAIVAALTHNFDAWIVGSAADPDNRHPRDFDVLVPHYQWGPAAHLIPKDATPNSFGGWKFSTPHGTVPGQPSHLKSSVNWIEIDVWPGDLGWIMQRPQAQFAWHPASGKRLRRTHG